MALINLRNAMMAGKRLPYDAEVEYLESTGTQWIDTGVAGQSGIDMDFGFSCTSIGDSAQAIGGCWTILQSLYVGLVRVNRYFAYHYGNTNYAIVQVQQVATNTYYHVQAHLYNGEQYYILNGSKSAVGTIAGDFASPLNIHLFSINTSTPTYSNGVRIYACKIYINGVLVRDFIPVRVGQVGYLYDRVSGKLFGNEGTGDFVLGPDVVPVEWLEGGQLDSGIAFINTGYTPNSSTKIESTAAVLSASGYSGRFGSRSRLTFGGFTGKLYLAQGDHYYLGGLTAGTFYSFVNDIPNRTVSVEGVGSTSTAAVSDWYPQRYPVYLFASNVDPNTGTAVNGKNLDTNSLGRIRMKSCNIWENDIPVRKFRPVRVGTEGAMMDVLTRRIYRNAGTGAFTYGNDLKYPIPAE